MAVPIDLSGRLALVTGGSRGIGAAVVKLLVAAGAEVAFSYRDAVAAARDLAAEVAAEGGVARAFEACFEDAGAGTRLVDEVEAAFGRGPDIVVANAGIWEHTPLASLDAETMRRSLAINFESVVEIVRRSIDGMAERGFGRIVMIGSTAGQRGESEHAAYAATKGALLLFARSIAVEYAARGVSVNTVAPGWVDTDMTRRAMEAGGRESIAAGLPRGQVATPEDIAGPVLFLCSDLCRHMVGSVLSVNGGSVMA